LTLKSVFLIRHAESLEDADPSLHAVKDEQVPLTKRGRAQVLNMGETWSAHFAESCPAVYVSPSKRAQETWEILSQYFPTPHSVTTDARIRNLDWGDTTLANRAQIEFERYKAGVLNYIFPVGSNTPDYVRAINELVKEAIKHRQKISSPTHVIMITHGFPLRVIARYLLALSDQQFKWLSNPPNGYCLEITYDTHGDRFKPTTPLLRMKPLELSHLVALRINA
jgi:broad specificity phosphatase PhoE